MCLCRYCGGREMASIVGDRGAVAARHITAESTRGLYLSGKRALRGAAAAPDHR